MWNLMIQGFATYVVKVCLEFGIDISANFGGEGNLFIHNRIFPYESTPKVPTSSLTL